MLIMLVFSDFSKLFQDLLNIRCLFKSLMFDVTCLAYMFGGLLACLSLMFLFQTCSTCYRCYNVLSVVSVSVMFLHFQVLYNVFQLLSYTAMAIFIMRLKMFWTPHLCLLSSMLASRQVCVCFSSSCMTG